MSERKLKKIQEANAQLKDYLEIPRVPVSEASRDLILYTQKTYDNILEMVKGKAVHDPFAVKESAGCKCVIMCSNCTVRKGKCESGVFSILVDDLARWSPDKLSEDRCRF
ncbi:hypothetical protein BB559_001503 [Furculomyces boomerangus]|uniref:G protein gamma domain-containing protein n=2 Tax=Harpellales TaxID=61421 RepID=A0A2T9Z1Q7_9FUNG|nr:hypothetical protein BB559_001503 [Furculomyces boomerangus]PVZ96570.1 hypothetical protein BB558_007510 [Smittium angustum]PWA01705.1 hypothetical protein BB558_002180 [Smittium angustum]